MNKKEKFAEPWKEFAKRWEKYYTPPGRPSKEAIKIYKQFTKEAVKGIKRQSRGLVLGATPELRDLLAELKFEVTMIDINMEVILAMSELTREKNPNEIVVKGDWTSNPLSSNYYDVVLGDLVLSNVPPEKQTEFLKEIRRVLRPGGYWITKIEMQPDNYKMESFDDILEKYSKAPLHKNRPQELWVDFHNDIWNPRTTISSTSKLKEQMEKYRVKKGKYKHSNKKITKYLNIIWETWKPMEKQWAFKYEKDTVRQLSPYFKVIKKYVLHDCYYPEVDETFPIWMCKVKK